MGVQVVVELVVTPRPGFPPRCEYSGTFALTGMLSEQSERQLYILMMDMCTTLIKYSKVTKQVLFSNDLPSRGSGCVSNKSCCLAPQAHQVGVAHQTPLISEQYLAK